MKFTEFEALSFDCYGTLIDWEAGIAGVLAPWAERRGLNLDQEQLLEAYADWPAFEDSHDALTILRERFKLIILSNVDRASFAGSQARLGVEFTGVLTAEEIGSYKPSPRNFDALAVEAERLGVAHGTLLHVAQSLFHDHVPAKRAGLPTVWINRRHDRPGWGATPAPGAEVTPDWAFPSMAAFASAVETE